MKNSLKIKHLSPKSLTPYKNNARIHSDAQIDLIAGSIKEFGFKNPVLIDENQMILAGHGRILAAIKLGINKIPVICHTDMTEAQKRAYIIADNRIAEKSDWDIDLLSIELGALSEDLDLSFDLELTGFNTSELDIMLSDTEDHSDYDDDSDLPQADQTAVTKMGMIWQIGNHRLICGDSLKSETYNQLLGDNKADMIFSDPPYNVKIDGHVGNSGQIKHREFAMASGEMSETEFTQFLTTVFKCNIAASKNGSIHYNCMDWRHLFEILSAGKNAGFDLKNICTWVKDNGGMGSLYRSRHEMVCVFKNGDVPHTNNIQLGKYGRYRTNVWEYPGVNTMRKDRMKDLAMHPTVKPVALIRDAIKDCSKIGDIILDPFGGSGSTMIAAERERRVSCLIEIDPIYCDTIVKRMQECFEIEAKCAETGHSFTEMLNTQEADDVR